MDTRIGAPSADAPHRGARHDGKGVLKGILHSAPIGLCLPTPKPAAIIFKTQNDAHGRPLSKTQNRLAAPPPRERHAVSQGMILQSAQGGKYLLGSLLLLRVTLGDDFLKDFAGTFLVAHLLVRLRQVKLGLDIVPTLVAGTLGG